MARSLVRTISLPQAIALYVAAVVGAGVLILPGLAATTAGPASVLAWLFDCVLGIPLALTFAALASRYPDAGGVATFTARAFGPAAGAAAGWFYFVAAATGQIIVPLTGAYYAGAALNLDRGATFALALAVLIVAVAANLRGLQVSGRLALALSAGVVLLLLTAVIAAIPRMRAEHWLPFAPHGFTAIGRAGVLIFFAFFGWEAIAHLTAEFRDPERDVVRSTLWSVGIITLLYGGVAVATIATATYGTPAIDRVAVARLLGDSLGVGAEAVAATMALIISLGTANAFVAAASRLGYALARDRAFPAWLDRLDPHGIPQAAVLTVGGYAALGLVLTYAFGWSTNTLLIVPNSLGIATYLVGMAAGMRLLAGHARWLAAISLLLCLAVLPFAGASVLLPLAVGVAAVLYQRLRYRAGQRAILDPGVE